MRYMVYIKSHCEAPDYEAEFEEEELTKRACLIKYSDDGESQYRCGGHLLPTVDGLRCEQCGESYVRL